MAKSNQLVVQMREILDDYTKEVVRATNNAQDVVAKEAASKLRNTSPVRTGKYAKSWKVKRERGPVRGINKVTVYNKDHYQLTHLLENGHVIRNAKGEYGRTSPKKHIEPVYDWTSEALLNEIERALR